MIRLEDAEAEQDGLVGAEDEQDGLEAEDKLDGLEDAEAE